MKLSEARGEQVLDIISAVVEPASRLWADPIVQGLFKGSDGDSGEFLDRLAAALPRLWRENRDDLVALLAAVNCQGADEYLSGLTFAKLFGDVRDVFTDKDLLGFLAE